MVDVLRIAEGGQNERAKTDLTPTQAKYVVARLTAKTITEAAQAVGVNERTARRWEQLPAVVLALRAQRDQVLSDMTTAAVGVMREGFHELAAIAKDKEMPGATRVAAWRVIFENGRGFLVSSDFAERLAALEERLSRVEG